MTSALYFGKIQIKTDRKYWLKILLPAIPHIQPCCVEQKTTAFVKNWLAAQFV